MQDFQCKLKIIKPISEWVQENEEGNCKPCLITPLASFYMGVLEKAGEKERVERLKRTFEAGDGLTICRELDKIKGEVGEAVRKELMDLDCFTQSYKPQDDAK